MLIFFLRFTLNGKLFCHTFFIATQNVSEINILLSIVPIANCRYKLSKASNNVGVKQNLSGN